MNPLNESRLSWLYEARQTGQGLALPVLDRSQSNEVVYRSVSFGVLRGVLVSFCPLRSI
jgi:hypothetical protein